MISDAAVINVFNKDIKNNIVVVFSRLAKNSKKFPKT